MRQIHALKLPEDIKPGMIAGEMPRVELVAPSDLYVDESYQRGLSERSVRLIRKIVTEWDWAAFKPPVVVQVDGVLQIIDGQHTAIAAATHGGITQIPVLLNVADEQASRANAFVRHNRDRVQVTPTQIHNAMVAAGDEDALTVQQVCERAGVRILKNPPPMTRYAPGDTMAITTIKSLINRRHAMGARKVLEVCVAAQAAPVSAHLIKAVECLMFAPEYRGEIETDRIAALLSSMMATLENEAERFAAERKVQKWRALASVIFMNKRKARHA